MTLPFDPTKGNKIEGAIARALQSVAHKKTPREFALAEDAKRRETFRVVNLSVAGRLLISHSGNFIVSDNQSTGIVSIIPNEQSSASSAAMNFYPGASYKGKFSSVLLSWAAQPGAFARVILGNDIEFKPGLGKTNAYNARNAYLAPILLLASVGNTSAVQLWNKSSPVPSPVNTPIDLVVRKIVVSSNVAQQYIIRMSKTALANVAVATAQKYQSGLNLNYYGAAEVRYVNLAAIPAGYVDLVIGFQSANIPVIHDFSERPFILGPLGGVMVAGATLNTPLSVTYEYEEQSS